MSLAGDYCTQATRGLSGYDREFIYQKALQGVPASAIANMLRKNLVDVQDAMPGAKPRRLSYASGAPTKAATQPARDVVRDYVPPSVRAILADVARRHDTTVDELCQPTVSKTRRQARCVAHARQEAMHLIYQLDRFSSVDIGGFLGGRDHTTVLYGIREHRRRLGMLPPKPVPPKPEKTPPTTVEIKRIYGNTDGIRAGRAAWPDGVTLGFFYDKLNGIVRLFTYEKDDAEEVTEEQARRIPALRQALAEDPRA